MTTAEQTAAIRAELKALGFGRKHVSVRKLHAGSIHVEILSADVPLAPVEAAAYKHESISRDHMTGEILCGGNTYVRVEYSDAAIAPIAAAIEVQLIDGKVEAGETITIGDVRVHCDGHRWTAYPVGGGSYEVIAYTLDGMAKNIARRSIARGDFARKEAA